MSYDNNSYYEPADDGYLIDLEERIYDAVKKDPEYDPSDLFKWGEALQQSCDNAELQSFLRDCIEQKDWEKLGRKLYYLSFEYQESIAEYYLTK
jgi:hypothetical protein